MKPLSRDDILAVDDRKPVPVQVAEWDGVVNLKPISGIERAKLEEEMAKARKTGADIPTEFGIKIVALSAVNGDGTTRLFKDEDVKALGQKSFKAISRLYKVCLELNAIGDDEIEELKKK